jgi:tRNA pseudouridine55 synthase
MARKAIPLEELPVVSKLNTEVPDPEIYSSGAVILMDKPLDWSSFHVVKYVRHRIPPKKVGHAGTLDPLATGLLVLCSGKATKSISQIQGQKKKYTATIRFGASTPSYDSATEPDETAAWEHITEEMIRDVLIEQFSGEIDQVPPIYSAIKVKGERLYKLARRGEDVDLKPRPVVIHNTKIEKLQFPEITISVECGKGTYIRSLAHDLGIALESRAHLTALRRTAIGNFDVSKAFLPEEFDTFMKRLTHN